MIDFSQKARELLVAFANSRKAQDFYRTTTYTYMQEPDLVPKGYYAVVRVQLIPFSPLELRQKHVDEITV